MPEKMNLKQARKFLKEVQPFVNSDRPQVVFDMSQVRHIDAAGVDVLLQCMRAAVKHDGDLKLAALVAAVRSGAGADPHRTALRDLRQFHRRREELQQLPAQRDAAI